MIAEFALSARFGRRSASLPCRFCPTGLAFGLLFLIPALIITARMIFVALPAPAQPSATRP
jgi:hypothetical protein